MRSNPYTGRRVMKGQSADRGHSAARILGRAAFFPVLLLYLELVLHISMGASLKYVPIWLFFSLSAGLLLGAVIMPFPKLANSILAKVLTFLLSLIYVVEMVAKKILQTYYPLSSLETAASNQLTDYMDVIVPTVLHNLPLILVFFLPPAVLVFVLGKCWPGFAPYGIHISGMLLVGTVVCHVLGLGMLNLPWKGDLPPAKLYRMDTNIDDQVEQFGVLTMLRLDIKHQISPPQADLGEDFSDLDTLGEASPTPSGSAAPEASVPPEPVTIDTSPNVMDVDLAALAENGKNEEIQWLANYFNSVTPTNKNKYTGMFQGYNVIELVLEGFSSYAIDPELTPTLYKLTHEGFVFHNYYTALHFTSTSNGECQTLLGLYPKNGSPVTMQRTGKLGTNCYFSLPQQLKRAGYQVLGYHANSQMYGRLESHTNLGYDWRQFGHNFDNLELSAEGKLLWPQRDSYMIEASVEDYIHSDTPFHVYYLTISGHMPYSDNRVVAPYRDTVRQLPYSETTQNYVATAMEVDKALKTLLDKLEAAGKLDKTLIVATADHIPYFDVASLEELAGKQFGSSDDLEYLKEGNIDFDVYKNSLILWSASMTEPVDVEKVCCQVDILPTLSNLLGLEYDSRMLAGTDILSDSEGLVIFTSRCWRSDRGFYNRFDQTFTPAEGVVMTPEEQEAYVSAMKKLVSYRLDSTARIIENDFYNEVFPGSKQ